MVERRQGWEVFMERLDNHISKDEDREVVQDKRWDRVFGFIEKLDDKLDKINSWADSNKEVPDKVNKLWDFHQQNKGFLSATRLLTAGVGGAVVAMIDTIFRKG